MSFLLIESFLYFILNYQIFSLPVLGFSVNSNIIFWTNGQNQNYFQSFGTLVPPCDCSLKSLLLSAFGSPSHFFVRSAQWLIQSSISLWEKLICLGRSSQGWRALLFELQTIKQPHTPSHMKGSYNLTVGSNEVGSKIWAPFTASSFSCFLILFYISLKHIWTTEVCWK